MCDKCVSCDSIELKKTHSNREQKREFLFINGMRAVSLNLGTSLKTNEKAQREKKLSVEEKRK